MADPTGPTTDGKSNCERSTPPPSNRTTTSAPERNLLSGATDDASDPDRHASSMDRPAVFDVRVDRPTGSGGG